MKLENWKRVIHSKEETTWQNISNPDILVQVQDDGMGYLVQIYNAKYDSWQLVNKDTRKNRAIDKAVDFMRSYK